MKEITKMMQTRIVIRTIACALLAVILTALILILILCVPFVDSGTSTIVWIFIFFCFAFLLFLFSDKINIRKTTREIFLLKKKRS